MSAGLDAYTTQRSARRIAALGLCGGVVCLLGSAIVYLAAAVDTLPLTWADEGLSASLVNLAVVAVAVVGTMLVSVGAIFALLEGTGVLAVLTAGPQKEGSVSNLPTPESQHGDVTILRGKSSGHRAVEAEDAAESPPEAQSPERRVAATETSVPPRTVATSPCEETLQPSELVAAWDNYRRNGDGHFSRRGLQEALKVQKLNAEVSSGDRVRSRGAVLVVETPSRPAHFYVLPSFNKSPRAVVDWFDDNSDGALTGTTRRVVRVAHGRWVDTGTETERRFEMIRKR